MRLPIRILAAAALLAGLLIALILAEDRARAQGEEAVLAMEAVDPRNLLTGHYVAIDLVHRLPAGEPCPAGLPQPPGRGWLALSKAADGRHILSGGGAMRAEAQAAGDIAVRGSAHCFRLGDGAEAQTAVRLEIGVDRFHADQAEAERIEALLRRRLGAEPVEAAAVVSVGRDGRARLKGIVLDGRRLDLNWW
ncbi:MAG: GDYXXLXY domain-containing protein [Phenylobacterium sp.]|uniref:GDYXXLXY domain-containing protein n=1 Tax=Phenylobacterium sp. TaxID=1871053 RepID=UPI003918B478